MTMEFFPGKPGDAIKIAKTPRGGIGNWLHAARSDEDVVCPACGAEAHIPCKPAPA